jgi:hypothetical protein
MEILYLIITLLVGVAIGVTIENYRLLEKEKLTKPLLEMPTVKDTYDVVDVTAIHDSPYSPIERPLPIGTLLLNMREELEPLMELETQYDPKTMRTKYYGRLKVLRR